MKNKSWCWYYAGVLRGILREPDSEITKKGMASNGKRKMGYERKNKIKMEASMNKRALAEGSKKKVRLVHDKLSVCWMSKQKTHAMRTTWLASKWLPRVHNISINKYPPLFTFSNLVPGIFYDFEMFSLHKSKSEFLLFSQIVKEWVSVRDRTIVWRSP